MSSRWLLALLLVPLFSSIVFSQKLINGFTREFAIQGLPTGFSLKSFDVTGDSVSELFVLTSSQLWVFDGETFSMIFKDSAAPGTANLSPADVNRDGSMDLITSVRDTAVTTWYGPDFMNRRVFSVDSGFGAFTVRNRDNGQVEFSFGFRHFHDTVYAACYNSYLDGYILRRIDTTFIFSDSIHLEISPDFLQIVGATNSDSPEYFLMGRDVSSSTCPSSQSVMIRVQHLDSQIVTLTSYGVVTLPGFPPCPGPILGSWVLGNIDTDSAKEFIRITHFSGYPMCGLPWWNFSAIDIRTGAVQWQRVDALSIFALLSIDLNNDEIQELLSYETRNSKPAIVEYQTTNGATLGFTELPFTPSTLLAGLFGDPPLPKLLLGHGDSIVVYGFGCAANKGDLNADGNVTIFDVTLELNCVFLGTGSCDLCFADVNCNGVLTVSDVILELLAVFLQRLFPCS